MAGASCKARLLALLNATGEPLKPGKGLKRRPAGDPALFSIPVFLLCTCVSLLEGLRRPSPTFFERADKSDSWKHFGFLRVFGYSPSALEVALIRRGTERVNMRSTASPAVLLLVLLHSWEAPQARAAVAPQDAVTTSVEQLAEVKPQGGGSSLGVGHDAEGALQGSPDGMPSDDGVHKADFRPGVRGRKSVLTALLLIAGYLLAHIMSDERGPSALLDPGLLNKRENAHLASAAAVTGLLLSGLGELLQSFLLRRQRHLNLPQRRRGMLQMVLAGFLYLSCIGAVLHLGPFMADSAFLVQFVSFAAAGLFFWGGALYFDPFGLVN
ncbi:uncharacterized protein EMH_0012860 [Eimeria mitis]|uniref:Uncharacterized protein n=1 Tax=Eimeria mitis TaxID=44415 RepID=U6K6T9_9EIME|nr:uncharacterized protein EMH_0012860 [Eimeria mitis]CDJ32546.1 hypothetical protein EMH_0012860 [Eimeria mitis]